MLKNASYNFPNLKVISGKNDLEMLAGPSIPENIELPENIHSEVFFKGKITAFESTIGLNSSFGAINLDAKIDKDENFSGKINVNRFDAGRLLKDTVLYGPVSLTAEVLGQGLDKESVMADIKGEVTELYLNRYTYQNLTLDGTIAGQNFSGKINLDDENAEFNFEGFVGLKPGEEFYQFRLDVPGADLQKLHITKEDIRVGLAVTANFEGRTVDKLYGKVGISNLTVAQGERVYVLDSLLFSSVNEPGKSEFNISSPLVDATYSGTISPIDISSELTRFINHYFPLSDTVEMAADSKPSDFSFEIQLHPHPILSQILIPQLNVFQPGIIQGSYNSERSDLKLNAIMNRIVYGTTEIAGLIIDVKSDASELNFSMSGSTVSNDLVKLDNFLIDGKLADNTLLAGLSSIDDDQRKKFVIRSQITKTEGNYKLAFNPDDFYLMYSLWDIDPENYIEFGDEGLLIHNLFMKNAVSQVRVASVNQQFNDDLNIELTHFKLDDISRIIEKDTSFVKGTVDGNALLKRVNNTWGVIADAKISNLLVKEVAVGDVTLKATNPETGRFDLDVNLSGPDNNLSAVGYFMADGDNNSINIKTSIQSLSMKTIEAFSMGQISESSGTVSGDLTIKGSVVAPDITGDLVFNDVFVNPASLNNRLHLSKETIQFKPGGIWFNSFTLSDSRQNKATINGSVQMKNSAILFLPCR
jgi:translocation and assembly module TamB